MEKKKGKVKKINITDEYSIVKGKMGFTLRFLAKEKKLGTCGKFVGKEVRDSYDKYYGVLHQALRGFIDEYTGRYSTSIENIVERVEEANEAIENLKSTIPEEWKVVKVVKG